MKKWKCEVCGYIHEGITPPEKCPVCGADKSKFVLIDEEPAAADPSATQPFPEEQAAEPPPPLEEDSRPFLPEMIYQQVLKHHLHPVSVHIPNGVIPMTVLFVFLSAIFGFAGLSKAAFYNYLFVSLSMPLVLATGYIEWQQRYEGVWTSVFVIKLVCGILVTTLAMALTAWLLLAPDVIAEGSSLRIHFLVVNVIMLAAAGAAGFLGGKLVFKE